jgi:hypothetical protein
VAFSGGYAYVTWSHFGLQAIDVSDPSSPVEVGHSNTPGDAKDVTFAGGKLFVADSMAGIEIFRVCPDLFFDGFESGDTSAWSRTVP